MNQWDKIYSNGRIHSNPSKELILLMPILKKNKVVTTLDAGCGTGRHTKYLAEQGFTSYGIDISKEAIKEAIKNQKETTINYQVGKLINLPYNNQSMDFIIANHSLQYASNQNVKKAISEIDRVLKPGRPLMIRVASTRHPFYKASSKDVFGFSHIGFCIQNNLPVHFFSEKELKEFFKNYRIERLEHISHKVNHKKISIPLSEWILFAYKN